MLSSDPAPYKAHGFLPLCSVAAAGGYANDCFSVPSDQTNTTVEGSFEGFDTSAPGVAETSGTVSEPSPRFHGYVSTSHLSLSELAHPTGSPIHERDIIPFAEEHRDAQIDDVPVLRGGGGSEYFYNKEQDSSEDVLGEGEVYSLRTTSTTKPSPQDAEGIEPTRTIKTEESSFPNAATERAEDSSHARDPAMKLDPETDSLLLKIAIAFPNASVISSSAYASEDIGNNTSVKNNNDNRHSGPVTDEPVPTDSAYQPKFKSLASPDGSVEEGQALKPFRVLDFDDLLADSAMDNPEIEKILPKPLSPRPSISSSRRRKKKKSYKPLSPINGNTSGLFDILQRSTSKEIALCRSGMRVEIVNATSGEVYVRDILMRMLWHFCGISALERLALGKEERVDILKIPGDEAEKSGIARVIRYMRRACTGGIVRPTGELRIPSFSAGIETVRACRIFGLEADARRIEELMTHNWMSSEEWYMTDEHVELIWNGHGGLLRETALGDAIAWFVLNEVQTDTHPLTDDIMWMLDQEDYESLKERLHNEDLGIRKRWRHESREEFLKRCGVEREQKRDGEEQHTGIRPRRGEPRRLYPGRQQTRIFDRGLERHQSSSTTGSLGLLDDD
jgi:hypothetical protein